jgi:hypothetical protein
MGVPRLPILRRRPVELAVRGRLHLGSYCCSAGIARMSSSAAGPGKATIRRIRAGTLGVEDEQRVAEIIFEAFKDS